MRGEKEMELSLDLQRKKEEEAGACGASRGPGPIAQAEGAKGDRRKRGGPSPKGGSLEARRLSSVILEVLAGQCTPGDAAQGAGISTSRYYLLESRALEGMIQACEPRLKGKQKTPQRRLEAMEEEQVRLKRECARLQALVRAAQRSIGLNLPAPSTQGKKGVGVQKGKGGRRRRRPVMRALRAARELRQAEQVEAAAEKEPRSVEHRVEGSEVQESR